MSKSNFEPPKRAMHVKDPDNLLPLFYYKTACLPCLTLMLLTLLALELREVRACLTRLVMSLRGTTVLVASSWAVFSLTRLNSMAACYTAGRMTPRSGAAVWIPAFEVETRLLRLVTVLKGSAVLGATLPIFKFWGLCWALANAKLFWFE